MGKSIEITGANYVYNINDEFIAEFDVRSVVVGSPSYFNDILTFSNIGVSGNFQTLGNKYINSAEITIPISNNVTINTVIVGITTDGNFAVVYMNNTGLVLKFLSTGVSTGVTLYTKPTDRPNLAKGNKFKVTHLSDRVNISYTGYSQDYLYSSMVGFSEKCIGLLATGSGAQNYDFKILS